MNESTGCFHHGGLVEAIGNLKESDKQQWETIRGNKTDSDKKLDAMKNWVIAGMGALIVQLAVFIMSIFKG
jgi:tRNA A22 N-methylase